MKIFTLIRLFQKSKGRSPSPSELADLKTVEKEIKSASSAIKTAGEKLVEDSELSNIKSTGKSLVDSIDEELTATKKAVKSSEEHQIETAAKDNESAPRSNNDSETKS